MIKRLEVIQATRRGHECSAPGCGKKIPGRMPAIALIQEDDSDEKKSKYITYFCSIDCYNEYEVRAVHAADAAHDEGNSQLVFS